MEYSEPSKEKPTAVIEAAQILQHKRVRRFAIFCELRRSIKTINAEFLHSCTVAHRLTLIFRVRTKFADVAGRRNDSAPLSLNYFGALAGTCVRYRVMDDALGNPPRFVVSHALTIRPRPPYPRVTRPPRGMPLE
ncbi:uncharacterized protein [Anoplolepis gracilipes]|uniref:uncharacterized protein n=1 Tax=Anoplolepis gracilipes TaxID=354296 RepID=UPI003BA03457